VPKKKLAKKASGGGAGDLPLRRSYERAALEARGKHKDVSQVKPQDRITAEEAREMKLTGKRREQRLAELEDRQVEEYMAEHGITDYGQAARAVAALHGDTHASIGAVPINPEVDIDQENAELKQILKERAQLEDDYAETRRAAEQGGIHNGGYRDL
jgi:hypothetical protein